ncbi:MULTISPECIES: lytic transglycosylase domain-containing protein [Odoribacteraceae]|uniref:lytic transglycosylase domain-containing protein n=1 Tax=Odoribacteraceae TaxID=1853231 RepID=UPI000E5553CF|nr:lytic transglycosylase domain-containing protein [Odoribacter sp. AF15-53]MCQ4874783.1 lytic transglycosylase domain-containing protein [Butyricimonas paravirosa]RHR80532.1 lytic transglycosylase domain-containing protein [Odoribacter sp. AF15-53]
MKNILLIFLTILVLLNSAAIGYYIYEDKLDQPENDLPVFHVMKTSDVEFPDKFSLAGERVPLERIDVTEAFKKELIVNTYLHSHTIQVLKHAPRYFHTIEPILKEEGVPDDFKYLAVIESSLNPLAVSYAGAVGIWQLMSGTAKELGLEVSNDVDERYHLEKATRAACAYLKKAYQKFGSWTLAAASYNGGMNMLSKQQDRQKETNFYDLLLGEETGRYVYRLLALKQIMEEPHLYDFYVEQLYPVEPVTLVKVTQSIKDLAEFAKEHGISYKTLKRFNPWLRQTSLKIGKHKTYYIAIPENKEAYK